MSQTHFDRRRLLVGMGAIGGIAALDSSLPLWARTMLGSESSAAAQQQHEAHSKSTAAGVVNLSIEELRLNIDGRRGNAVAINGTVPGPLVRLQEGSEAVIRVSNKLGEFASIHWHGLLVPPDMDGVPGVSFAGIRPQEVFDYRFPVRQYGTYWYHSHSGGQEQLGVYAPIIIDPIKPDPFDYDREYVVMLSDWSFSNPMTLLSKLKKQPGYFNRQRRTVGDLISDLRRKGFASTVEERSMWARMRMDPTDFADISGVAYTYLINGHSPKANWTGAFSPGEKVRLRFINAAAGTFFDVRVPGLKLRVVQADGQNVKPVAVDEFRIGPAETYDVIVAPQDRAYTIFAENLGRSGYTRATLAPREGMNAEVPRMRPRPIRTMADMGMSHGSMPGMKGMQPSTGGHEGHSPANPPAPKGHEGHRTETTAPMTTAPPDAHAGHGAATGAAMGGMTLPGVRLLGPDGRFRPYRAGKSSDSGSEHKGHAAPTREGYTPDMQGSPEPKPAMPEMDHSKHSTSPKEPAPAAGHEGHEMPAAGDLAPTPGGLDTRSYMHEGGSHGAGNSATPMSVSNRMTEPGIGLDDTGTRVLVYTDLVSAVEREDQRPPSREIELHITGNMDRFMWGFNGRKYSEAGPVRFNYGERLRLIFVNDTMMEHPIHLHGMWMELENGAGKFLPRKHTVSVKPAERLPVLITADAPGHWAMHCHLLLHMERGMFRVVEVIENGDPDLVNGDPGKRPTAPAMSVKLNQAVSAKHPYVEHQS